MMMTKTKIVLLMQLFLIVQTVHSQVSEPYAEILSSEFGKGDYHIEFVIRNGKNYERYDLKLLLYNNQNKTFSIKNISGDKNIAGDQRNVIYWYWSKDRDTKPEIINQKITIDKINKIFYELTIVGRSWTKIIIDGDFAGYLGQKNNYSLTPGQHTLQAELNGYETYETIVDLEYQTSTINLELKEKEKTAADLTDLNLPATNLNQTKTSSNDWNDEISAVALCLLGNEQLSNVTPKWSIYCAYHNQTINPPLISTAAKYPFYEQLKNRSLLGGGFNLTLLPFMFDVDITVDLNPIKSQDVSGSENITMSPDSVLFKMYYYRVKAGICPFVLLQRIYPFIGVVSQGVTVDFQTGGLKKNITLESNKINYQEFGLFANVTFRLSRQWVFVLGYEKFYKTDAFAGGFYSHLGLYL